MKDYLIVPTKKYKTFTKMDFFANLNELCINYGYCDVCHFYAGEVSKIMLN
jgi:hypothetical protein